MQKPAAIIKPSKCMKWPEKSNLSWKSFSEPWKENKKWWTLDSETEVSAFNRIKP